MANYFFFFLRPRLCGLWRFAVVFFFCPVARGEGGSEDVGVRGGGGRLYKLTEIINKWFTRRKVKVKCPFFHIKGRVKCPHTHTHTLLKDENCSKKKNFSRLRHVGRRRKVLYYIVSRKIIEWKSRGEPRDAECVTSSKNKRIRRLSDTRVM